MRATSETMILLRCPTYSRMGYTLLRCTFPVEILVRANISYNPDRNFREVFMFKNGWVDLRPDGFDPVVSPNDMVLASTEFTEFLKKSFGDVAVDDDGMIKLTTEGQFISVGPRLGQGSCFARDQF